MADASGEEIPDTDFQDNTVYTEGAEVYVTAAWDEEDIYNDRGVPESIVVGRGNSYLADIESRGEVEFMNVPLKPNREYVIYTRYDIRNEINPTEVSHSYRS